MAEDSLSPGGIYAIRNTVNGQVYIGSTAHFKRRFNAHRSLLAQGRHHSVKLQRAWIKYGASAFLFEILERVAEPAALISKEQAAIDRFRSFAAGGYNMSLSARCAMLGRPMSAETKAKISAATRGLPKPLNQVTFRGKKHTPEHIAKIVIHHIGKKRSAETCAKISQSAKGHTRWLGKNHSPETKAKISALAKAREHKKGYRHTEASIDAMSRSHFVPVQVDGVVYGSYRAAAEAFGCCPETISRWVRIGRASRAGVTLPGA